MHLCPFFGVFPAALELSGAAQRVLQPPWFAFAAKFNKPAACCHQTARQSSACFLTLNQMEGRLFVQQFHRLYFPPLDASKMKLVSLSPKPDGGFWESLWESGKSDPENTAVCVTVCFFRCHFLTYTTSAGKPDVLPCFIASQPQERGEPPAGGAHHDLEYL